MLLILTLGRQRGRQITVSWGQPDVHSKFQASQSYTLTPSQDEEKEEKEKEKRKDERERKEREKKKERRKERKGEEEQAAWILQLFQQHTETLAVAKD